MIVVIRLYILVGLLFLSAICWGQSVEFKYDTITFLKIKEVDSVAREITASADIFFIGAKLYSAANFPFTCIKCKTKVDLKQRLYYEDFTPIINQQQIDKLKNRLRRMKYKSIVRVISENEGQKHGQILNELYRCLPRHENRGFIIASQKIVAHYFLIKCEIEEGVHDNTFCEEMIDSGEVPVLMNIEKMY